MRDGVRRFLTQILESIYSILFHSILFYHKLCHIQGIKNSNIFLNLFTLYYQTTKRRVNVNGMFILSYHLYP